jgi:hypothetical protein
MYCFGFDKISDNGWPISNVYGKEMSLSYGFLLSGMSEHQINVNKGTVDDLIKEGVNFIYFIDGKPDPTFASSIILSDELVNYAKEGKCKICINAMTEYFYGNHISFNMNLIGTKYDLNPSNLIFITGNLIAENKPEDKFTYVSYNYFLDYPWFINKERLISIPKNYSPIEKKILCYNRRPHVHRKILVYEILNNPTILNNIILSYGGTTNKFPYTIHNFSEKIKTIDRAKKINEFFQTMEFEINVDTKNLELNLADDFDYFMHHKTFISLVSETNVNPDNLFFSEKTYKPIVAKQPFIMYGNPHSLKYLKSIGFKTFDKWIDESYDDEKDFENRLDKVLKVCTDISNMDVSDLYKIRKEMDSVLEHNYNVFFELTDLKNFLDKLFTFKTFNRII